MHFLKVEGAGNDYVLVDGAAERVGDPAALAREVADRHLGIGSDGLLLLEPTGTGGVAMRIFNADGSEGRMCGNGLRCVVRLLADQGRVAGDGIEVETASGPRRGRLRPDGLVEVSMGVPDFDPAALPSDLPLSEHGLPAHPLPRDGWAEDGVAYGVSVGNPHLVLRVADVGAVDLARLGPALEASPRLADGANVHVVERVPGGLCARTWERGSGLTRACGTGAVAVAAVGRRLGWTTGDEAAVAMPGGGLAVRWDGTGEAWLAGPARIVFAGEWPGR